VIGQGRPYWRWENARGLLAKEPTWGEALHAAN
jgi:hypothetical protein